MKLAELQPKQGKVDVVVDVVSVEQPREFNKFGKSGRVCNALVKDESGQMKLTLWNEDVDKIRPGMKVHITNGYVNEWQGEMQLTTGKFGTLEVMGAAEVQTAVAPKMAPPPADDWKEQENDPSDGLEIEEESF